MANISDNCSLLNENTDFLDFNILNFTIGFPLGVSPVNPSPLIAVSQLNDNYTSILNESINFYHNGSLHESYENIKLILHVVTFIIAGIGLPLLLMTVYALYSLVKNGQVAPVYIINLFISDLIQLCCMIVWETKPEDKMIQNIVSHIYDCCVLTSVGFMVCISLERYLLIAHPLWYRFRRTISVAVCAVVWIISLVLSLTVFPWVPEFVEGVVLFIFLISPLPLFLFFLVGTLRALSTSVSVPSSEKRRIVAILVLVLLIYSLLFLPYIFWLTAETYIHDFTLLFVSDIFVRLSPLADLLLYVFFKKETFGKLWTSVCCYRKENNDTIKTRTPNLEHM